MGRSAAEPRKTAALHFEGKQAIQSVENRQFRVREPVDLRESDHRVQRGRRLLEAAVRLVNQNLLCLLEQRGDAVQISNHYEAIAVETFFRNVQPNRLCRSVQLHDGRSLDLRVFYDFKRTSESRLLCTWIEYCSASNGFGVFDRIDVAF